MTDNKPWWQQGLDLVTGLFGGGDSDQPDGRRQGSDPMQSIQDLFTGKNILTGILGLIASVITFKFLRGSSNNNNGNNNRLGFFKSAALSIAGGVAGLFGARRGFEALFGGNDAPSAPPPSLANSSLTSHFTRWAEQQIAANTGLSVRAVQSISSAFEDSVTEMEAAGKTRAQISQTIRTFSEQAAQNYNRNLPTGENGLTANQAAAVCEQLLDYQP